MTNKDVQLFILRHLEAGNTVADEHILADIPAKQRRDQFIDALITIEDRGFLCPNYSTNDKPELRRAYVSDTGRAFIRENTPEPVVQTIRRSAGQWLEIVAIITITAIVTTLINLWIASLLK